MKVGKIVAISFVVYVGLVIAFESMLGFFQPAGGTTLVITTTADGESRDRVVSRLESNGQVYVAANHWLRAWFNRALENPDVQVTYEGATADYVAVPATQAEHERVHSENNPGVIFRVLTGFPPRYFLRLDPR
jgi:hypothetical protein